MESSNPAAAGKGRAPRKHQLGTAPFMGETFYCSRATLIPRDETRLLVEAVLKAIGERTPAENELTLIEIGTGCGNIAISLALHTKGVRILSSDISAPAIEVARRNVEKFHLEERVSLFCGDLFGALRPLGYEGKADFVVCNPPYIPTSSLRKLAPEIVDYEPRVALDGGTYGVDFHQRLMKESLSMLRPGGRLFFEIGEGQEKLIRWLFGQAGGYREIKTFAWGGKIRVFGASRK